MQKVLMMIFLTILLAACASVRARHSALGNNRYLVTCDGNGYAHTSDTMHCLTTRAEAICASNNQNFRIVESQTESQLHVGVNFANGRQMSHTRPHSAATVECYGQLESVDESDQSPSAGTTAGANSK